MEYRKSFVKPDGRKLMAGGPRDLQRKQQQDQVIFNDLGNVDELKIQIKELRVALSEKPAISAEDFDKELRISVADAIIETEAKYKKEIRELKNELVERDNEVPQGYLSPEQVDEEMDKAVKEAVDNLTLKLEDRTNACIKIKTEYEDFVLSSEYKVNNLSDRIRSLNNKLESKEEIILILDKKVSAPIDINDERIADLIAQKISIDSSGVVSDPNQPKMETSFIDPAVLGAEDVLKGKIKVEDVVSVDEENIADKTDKLKNLIGKLPKVV